MPFGPVLSQNIITVTLGLQLVVDVCDAETLQEDEFFSFCSVFFPIQTWHFSPSPCVSLTQFDPFTSPEEKEDRAIKRDALVTRYLGKH